MALANAILPHFFLIIYCRVRALEFKTKDKGFAGRSGVGVRAFKTIGRDVIL